MDSSAAKPLTREHLDWPFFGSAHADWAAKLDAFAKSPALAGVDHSDTDNACRALVKALGKAGLLEAAVSLTGDEGIDSRKLCIARETLAYHDGLADFAFCYAGALAPVRSASRHRTNSSRPCSRKWQAANGFRPLPCRKNWRGPTWRQ